MKVVLYCIFPGCLSLLDTLPETVYRVCELLIVVTQRNGQQWQNKILTALVEEVGSLGILYFYCVSAD